jgi:hypothetical protein
MTAGNPPREPALDRPDRVDAITDFLAPTIEDILSRIEGDEFTTTEFIALIQSDPEANAAYLEALRRWGEGERAAKMVVHGQVIPGVLRRSIRVEWLGFAHGENDPYAVPGRWGLVSVDRDQSSSETKMQPHGEDIRGRHQS